MRNMSNLESKRQDFPVLDFSERATTAPCGGEDGSRRKERNLQDQSMAAGYGLNGMLESRIEMPAELPTMTDLERFHATMNYCSRDRAPFHEFPWPTWSETADQWSRRGVRSANNRLRLRSLGDRNPVVLSNPPFEREILEQDETTITYVDPQGIIMREFKKNPQSSMPTFLRFPVETRADFRKFWVERMQPDLTARIGPDWRERLGAHRDRDYVLVLLADRWGGFFGSLRNLVGVERLCTLFYDDRRLWKR